MVNMDQYVSDGCTCGCKDHNDFTVWAAQTLVTVERQMSQARGHDKDNILLGMLTASQNDADAKLLLVLHVHVLRWNTQSRTSLFASQCSAIHNQGPACLQASVLQYTIKDQPVCKPVFCNTQSRTSLFDYTIKD